MNVCIQAIVVSVAISASCATDQSPMRTALVDLTGESRTIRVYPSAWSPCPIAVHKQALSIGGLLNMPDVGQEFEFQGAQDVTTAVGIAVLQSYRLVGETPVPSDLDAVTKTREALERVQSLALDASLVAADIVSMQDSLESSYSPRLERMLDQRLERREALENELATAKKELREFANTPGIIVARWSSKTDTGVHAGISGARLDSPFQDARSGFVILGGLRVVSLVLGEDFWWMLNNLRPHEKKHVEQIGITTSLLQAKYVAYTSDALVQRGLALQAQLGSLDAGGLASAKVSAYWSFAGQYANAGNLPPITWTREPFCAVCSLDLPGLAAAKDRALQRGFCVENEPVDPASYQGWRTVSANITFLRDMPVGFKWTSTAKKYEREREMWPAPSCPYCGKHSGPARVPGLHSDATGPGCEPSPML